MGKVVSKDHRYNGELVLIELRLFNNSEIVKKKEIGIRLDITFGEFEEKFEYKNPWLFGKVREHYIRFGIKHGKLCLKLQNGAMPLNKRVLLKDPHGNWLVRTTGVEEAPTWEFEARDKLAVLRGSRVDEELGILDLTNTSCVVEATFKISVNGNDLEITAQDGAWDDNTKKAVKETKRRAFFKRVLEPKLKDYLSKVVLQYD